MALVAPLSKYKKKTFLIWMGLCFVFAVVFAYDGYLSKYKWSMRYSFYEKHVLENDGKPDDTMVWNQKWLPLACGGMVILFGAYLFIIRNKKVVADDTGLVIDDKLNIAYDSILKIDKTRFDSNGRFTITYRLPNGKETDLEISDRNYDNLKAILDHTVAKIS
ncbi:MAG: hypothetical protein JW749_03205 [Sedimentisphaerales bacterium]|nr:hypothetical protein [Sedimentisphaerales bacterium]